MRSVAKDPCEVCTKEQAETLPVDFDGIHQVCPRCGEFKLSGTAGSILRRGVGDAKRALLSGWVREQNQKCPVKLIRTDCKASNDGYLERSRGVHDLNFSERNNPVKHGFDLFL